MNTDATIRERVIEELARDPRVTADGVGVSVHHGVVTLTGHVPGFSERQSAASAAQRVPGVKAVAQELLVRLPEGKKRADDEIAERAVSILGWTLHEAGNIKVTVDGGWVTLTGEVDWGYQKKEAEHAIRLLGGVTGVYNNIRVRPQVDSTTIRDAIRAAFRRTADEEGAGITIDVDGSTVTLSGKVSGWREREAAEDAAWSIPGVSEVRDKLLVT